MRPQICQAQIRPKVSSIPRQQTEASAYLDIYKLVNEKKRLQQELEKLEQRRDRIQQRLQTIDVEVEQLKQSAQNLSQDTPVEKQIAALAQTIQSDFSTLFLEY
jgi:predicted nuclease with TOPRIM domain